MPIVVKDRVKVATTTTGTSDFTLGSAALGFQSFAAIGNGNQTYYAAADPLTGDWEVGYGTYTTAGPTLTRTVVLSSSAAGAKVSFSAGNKDVFCTYPSSKAIYEETSGNVLIDGGPITVVGTGVTSFTTFGAALAELYANTPGFAQMYAQNLSNDASASTDIVAYNDLGDGTNNFIDMGIASSNYTEAAYPIFTPGSGYLYNDGGELIIGSATDDVVLFAGGVALTDEAVRIDKTTKALTAVGALSLGGALDVTGAASFGSTVLLDANPTTALQAATKQYVDNQVTAGLHIHEPVRVETTGNLTATYAQGGTTFNITTITGTDTVTTSVNHGLVVNDQIWLTTTAGNGLSVNIAYFVFSTPAVNTLTLSLTFDGSQITGLTNAAGLTYATRANSGVGATLTNSGAQAALVLDGITLSVADRVMVRLQTAGAENGVYAVTSVGSGSTNWVLTRATDSNQVNPSDPNGVGTGDYYFTQEGVLNAGDSHVLTTEPNTMIIGYTTLTYTQFSGSVDYVGGTNISVVGQTISLTGTVAATNGGTGTSTVTTGDLLYGSATNTWSRLPIGAGYRSLIVNAGGTQVEWNAVALNQSGAVSGALPVGNGGTGITSYAQGEMLFANTTTSLDKVTANTTTTKKFLAQTGTGTAGLAPVWNQPAATDITGLATSATTDTTDAANITSGTLPTGRISGSYIGITGTGALAAGSLAAGFTAVSVPLGGTGFSSYAVGDLIYADTTTSFAKLPDVAVGNALISGGVGSAPSYGKIGLATHVSGTLPVANGGTGVTSSTGTGSVVLSDSPSFVNPNLGTPLALIGTNITGTATNFTASNVTTNANLTGMVTSVGNNTTVVTNANLAGVVTSIGNTTSLGSFSSSDLAAALSDETGTGFAVFATSPTLVTPNLGTPSTLVGTNITGTATAFTASNVTTNANLTGDVTSSGNSTTLSDTAVTPGSYTNTSLTVDSKGRITAASNGSAVSGVSSFSAGTTGLTPSTVSTGDIVLAGTLAVANGGTGVTTSTGSGANVLGTSPTISGQTINGGYTEQVFAVTGATPALSVANGSIQTWTLPSNCTPTSSLTTGQSLTLMITASTFTITWPSVTWKTGSGVAPTLNTSGVTAIQLWNVGSVLYGARVGNN